MTPSSRLVLHDLAAFPNPARVRIALYEKGIFDQVQCVEVDVMNGEHRGEAFRAMNPDASVPCLVLEDGTALSQCTAIIEYLDAHTAAPSLTGINVTERGVISMMNRRAEANLLDAVGAYFHHATAGLGPVLEQHQNRDWGLRQREVAVATLSQFNELLATQDWLAGERFSVADITAFAGMCFIGFTDIEVPETLTHLHAWHARVLARESVKAWQESLGQ
ncbi:glutathione S-transferase family protein [Cobetia sp. QF-1]|uniref:glutathione S-transferase family protein n=1 Tax=Cobetia sp. QF-1 TaxID=1969833 RepID=UPI000B53BF9B|nr:glutathione S-transferase [Cobetia sp. QF-1]